MHNRRWLGVLALGATLLACAIPLVQAQDEPVSPEKRAAELVEGGEVSPLMELYEVGGRTMWFLTLASVIGMASVMERTISTVPMMVSVFGPYNGCRYHWSVGGHDVVEGVTGKMRGIMARIIHFIAGHRRGNVSDVSASVGDMASQYVRRQMRWTYPLVVVATVSPLLGLLGTILGMIEAFEKVNIAGSMGSAEYLSGAISKALVTTASGLIIAIPALFFYHIFRFIIGVLADTLQRQGNTLINEWMVKTEAA